MQVYWTTKFIIPCEVIRRIESILTAFLWTGPTMGKGGAKVAWKLICRLKQEGGLGVKRLKEWNRAATMKHIWVILNQPNSIWTSWVKNTLLKGKSLWQAQMPSSPTWAWRKILQVRDQCRDLFTSKIGNGKSTSL